MFEELLGRTWINTFNIHGTHFYFYVYCKISLEHQTFNFTNPIGKDEAKSLPNELI